MLYKKIDKLVLLRFFHVVQARIQLAGTGKLSLVEEWWLPCLMFMNSRPKPGARMNGTYKGTFKLFP
jgi:hypothetical protein